MDYKNKTDEELVYEAGRARPMDSAPVEMMRRLKNAIEKFDKNSHRLSTAQIVLSFVLLFVAFIQVVVSVLLISIHPLVVIIIYIVVALSIVCAFIMAFRAFMTKK